MLKQVKKSLSRSSDRAFGAEQMAICSLPLMAAQDVANRHFEEIPRRAWARALGINSRGGLGVSPSIGGLPQVRRSLTDVNLKVPTGKGSLIKAGKKKFVKLV